MNEQQLEAIKIVTEAFKKMRNKESISEEELQMIKDVTCGGSMFNRTFMSDEHFWGIINSTVDTIYDNFEILEESLIRCAYCVLNGWNYTL